MNYILIAIINLEVQDIMEKIKPLTDAEFSIWMCRLQGAVFEED